MRLRRKPETREALAGMSPPLVKEPEKIKGNWKGYFNNDNPLYLEIGIGKGNFLYESALRFPQANYIGMEFREEMVFLAIKKQKQLLLNSAYIWKNALLLENYFAKGELARIYLNFSDPWPRKKHAKRRLTHRNFLIAYEGLLHSKGEIHFKTDNRGLFDFSLEELAGNGWKLKNVSYDLYAELPEDNIATEYERKFSSRGEKIYRLEAVAPLKEAENIDRN